MQREGGRRRRLALGLGTAGLAAALACGGGDEAAPSDAPTGGAEADAARGANAPPVIERLRLQPRDPAPDAELYAEVQARDPDGDAVEIRFTWRVNGEVVARKGSRFQASNARPDDRVELEVVAIDGELESETRRVRERFANRPPRIREVELNAQESLRPGTELTALVDARDPDGHRLRFEYEWLVNGEETDAREKTFSTEGLERGDEIAVRVVARDGRDASEPERSDVLAIGNSPPRITGVPQPVRENGVFKWDFEAEDPDGDSDLRFRLGEAPEGMTIDPILGVVHWRPSASQAGTHAVEVRVEDGAGAVSGLRFEAEVAAGQPGDDAGTSESGAPPAAPSP